MEALFAAHNPLAEWLCNSNDAVCLSLVSTHNDPSVANKTASEADHAIDFHPLYTYPVFGDEEKVFGYKDLKIKLYYAAGSLYTYLGFTYSSRIGEGASKMFAPGVQPQNVVEMINQKIPAGAAHNYDQFMKQVRQDEHTFRPMGVKIHEYTVDNKVFEMYECTFDTLNFIEYHKRLQTFLLWFIEGASYLEDKDKNWQFVLVFEKESNFASGSPVYKIVGYLSYYPFYHYPDTRRMRISQFIILPPYQHQGHGRKLYTTMMDKFIGDSTVVDITVEDPNDEFQDLRDRCDVQRLLECKALAGLSAPLDSQCFNAIRGKYKLCKRQAYRCLEIVLLHQLNRNDARANRLYRLFVKARIFQQNCDVLKSLPFDERVDRLHETYLALEQDYQNVLSTLE
ncbi:histone acetyltransferase 1 [Batrachochytrium dendrobatidis]|nr:histone acetyltransferase 1 [Batrachochytrium dendrobatidis]KAK5670675.1 histone acetyltransferase 1 [Batrachochytrium dendrobatidis]